MVVPSCLGLGKMIIFGIQWCETDEMFSYLIHLDGGFPGQDTEDGVTHVPQIVPLQVHAEGPTRHDVCQLLSSHCSPRSWRHAHACLIFKTREGDLMGNVLFDYSTDAFFYLLSP